MKTLRTVLTFLYLKGLTYAYLVKIPMTHNEYLTFLFLEDNDSIPAKPAATNTVFKSHIDFSSFESSNYWFM